MNCIICDNLIVGKVNPGKGYTIFHCNHAKDESDLRPDMFECQVKDSCIIKIYYKCGDYAVREDCINKTLKYRFQLRGYVNIEPYFTIKNLSSNKILNKIKTIITFS